MKFLKTKLRNFLEKLLELSDWDYEITQSKKDIILLRKKLSESDNEIRILKDTIKNTISLAMDVNMNKCDPTWGILCYKQNGQSLIHKFDLGNADGREIKSFLESFGSAYRHLDTPPEMRNIFY